MFRVSHQSEGIDDADTIDGAREIVRDSLRATTTWTRSGPSRSRGAHQPAVGPLIRRPDVRVEDEPWPWE